jgi:PglZ domain
MSLRLLNWLAANSPTEFDSFPAAAQFYARETSYVDWARSVILHGDTNDTFAGGLTALQKLVTQKREEQNKNFGHLLVGWTENGSTRTDVWRVEEVLAEVVAKTAAQKRVLLIVMDGMNYAAFHEIKKDLQKNGWQSFAPKNEDIKPVIAAVPSVTSVLRTSLLCGKLLKGNSSTEVKGFSKNQILASLSKTGYPPKVFHKASIAAGRDERQTISIGGAFSFLSCVVFTD